MTLHHRSGFTLIEVLAAAALSAVILLAVYRAFDMASHYRRLGREQTHCDAVGASVLCMMERLIENAYTRRQLGEVDSAWNPYDSFQYPPGSSARPIQSRRFPASAEVWMAGTKQSLLLDLPFAGMSSSTTPDSQINIAFSASCVGLSEMAHIGLGNVRNLSNSYRTQATGVCVTKLRRLSSIDSMREDAWEVIENKKLTDELTGVSFRYFDGATWRSTWTNLERTPLRAIEITVDVRVGSTQRQNRLVVGCDIRGGGL